MKGVMSISDLTQCHDRGEADDDDFLKTGERSVRG